MPREALQMRLRMLALAIRRVAKPHRRWIAAARRPVIAHIGPQPPGLGLAASRIEHRHRRVVGVQLVGRQHVAARAHRPAAATSARCPATQSARVERSSSTPSRAIDLRLPVQRQMIGILGHHHMGEQPGAGKPRVDRPRRRRQLHDPSAARAGELRAHMADHLEVARARTPASRTRPRRCAASLLPQSGQVQLAGACTTVSRGRCVGQRLVDARRSGTTLTRRALRRFLERAHELAWFDCRAASSQIIERELQLREFARVDPAERPNLPALQSRDLGQSASRSSSSRASRTRCCSASTSSGSGSRALAHAREL